MNTAERLPAGVSSAFFYLHRRIEQLGFIL